MKFDSQFFPSQPYVGNIPEHDYLELNKNGTPDHIIEQYHAIRRYFWVENMKATIEALNPRWNMETKSEEKQKIMDAQAYTSLHMYDRAFRIHEN